MLANIVSTGLVSLLVLDQYNCAVAHSVYYGLVLLDGFEAENLHGDVVAYGVLVQLLVDGEEEKQRNENISKESQNPHNIKRNGCICEAGNLERSTARNRDRTGYGAYSI